MIPCTQYQAMFMDRLAPYLWIIVPLAILDGALKCWSAWRAARMGRNIWFIVLLIINSAGILPAIFLLLTKNDYAKRHDALLP